jgi:predicted alpha/beta-hydrolase family hydrolase
MRTSVVPSSGAKSPPHVVVIGNQKGGSGKSTFAMHIIVALLKAGKRVVCFSGTPIGRRESGKGPSRTSRTRSSRLLWGAAARRIAGSHKIIGKRRLASLRVARNRNAGR